MKISEAILEGCKAWPKKAKGTYFVGRMDSACVLGAAVAGFYKDSELGGILAFRENFQESLGRRAKCPHDCGLNIELEQVLVHLNDDTDWERERIATWLARQGL